MASSPEPNRPIVFVVDDDVSIRDSFALLIRSAGWQPMTFGSAQAFLDAPRAEQPSCLLLDLSMPELDGLALQERVTREHPELPVIFVTGRADVPQTVQAMKAGAIEFLTKPVDSEVLIAVVAAALARSRSALERRAGLQAMRDRYASLSPREREVMALVVAGLANQQIGDELGISLHTVKAHRGSVMRKMAARSVPALVNVSAKLGIARSAARDPG